MITINKEEIRIELAKLLGYKVVELDAVELGLRPRGQDVRYYLESPSGRDMTISPGRWTEEEAWLDCPDWTADLETAHLLAEKNFTVHMPTNDSPYAVTLPVPGKKAAQGWGETAALAFCQAMLTLLRERKGKGDE